MKAMAFHQVFFFHGHLYIPMEEGWFFWVYWQKRLRVGTLEWSPCHFNFIIILVSNIYHLLDVRSQIDAGVDQLLTFIIWVFLSFSHLAVLFANGRKSVIYNNISSTHYEYCTDRDRWKEYTIVTLVDETLLLLWVVASTYLIKIQSIKLPFGNKIRLEVCGAGKNISIYHDDDDDKYSND